jgi:hypothetical protein
LNFFRLTIDRQIPAPYNTHMKDNILKMNKLKNAHLLKDRKVVEEINRHLWIESEKAGHDIGFDQAAADWLKNFSKAWMDYHVPKRKSPLKKLFLSSKKALTRKGKKS